jgi:4-amino-4-deoxy-L-arabinose transferase-like glycosyltransferase
MSQISTVQADARTAEPQTIALAGILAVAAGLRLYGIGVHGLWQDEIASVLLAQDLTRVADPLKGHAPLYYALLSIWDHLGKSEAWMRGLSTAIGLGVVATVYVVSKSHFGKRSALLAAWLVAVSPVQILASREARGYILLHFFVLLAIWAWTLGRDTGRLTYWFLFGAFAAASIYTHYYAVFILPAFVPATLLPGSTRLRRRVAGLASGSVFAVLLFTPWLPVFLAGQQGLSGYAREVNKFATQGTFFGKTLLYLLARSDPPHLLGAAAESVSGGRSFTWLSLLALAALATLIVKESLRPQARGLLTFWTIMCVAPTLLAVIANGLRDVFLSTRYLAFNSALLAVPAAFVFRRLEGRRLLLFLGGSLALSVVGSLPLYALPTSEIREGIQQIDESAQPGDCVGVLANKAFCYRYYSQRPLPVFDLPWEIPAIARKVDASTPLRQRAIQAEELPAIIAHFQTCRTAWILYNEDVMWGVDMGAARLRQALNAAGFRPLLQRSFSDTRVEGYRPPEALP